MLTVARITKVNELEYCTTIEKYANKFKLGEAQLNCTDDTLVHLTDTTIRSIEIQEECWKEQGIKFNSISDLIVNEFKTYCNE